VCFGATENCRAVAWSVGGQRRTGKRDSD
jgi:hypothetical protein